MAIRKIITAGLVVLLPVVALAQIPVAVQELGEVLIAREFRAPATVVAANRTVVTSQITALIDEILVDVADDVEQGELLVRLDPADTELALAAAEAGLAALEAELNDARQRLRRAEDLLTRSFVSEDELNIRQTEVAIVEANRDRQRVVVREARLALARAEVSAPFDAVVVERQGQAGNLATPGSPLLTLVQTEGREVDVELDPRYADRLPSADDLRFVSEGREWAVVLARLSGVIEPDTRKLRARFAFAAAAAPIGASGELVWHESSELVPVSLIVQRGNQLGIFSASDGKARFIALPGAQEGRPAAIDLPPETPIVTRGHVRLQDGDTLQISQE